MIFSIQTSPSIHTKYGDDIRLQKGMLLQQISNPLSNLAQSFYDKTLSIAQGL